LGKDIYKAKKNLLHVSYEKLDILKLEPRIPLTPMEGENKTIPRICFSSELEGCFKSIPEDIESSILSKVYNGKFKTLYLYTVKDLETLNSEDIVTTDQLDLKKLVPDAKKTNEIWILKPIELLLTHTVTFTTEMLKYIEENEDGEFEFNTDIEDIDKFYYKLKKLKKIN